MIVYLIAGEPSGDNIGAGIITELKKKYPNVKIVGIGGPKMLAAGLEASLFEMSNISIIGFAEVLSKIFRIKKLINNTIQDIILCKPDALITIDSPGFCYRVTKQLSIKNLYIPMFHVVAPTVWAYKEYRAKMFAEVYQHLFVILPFEPPLFEKYGLATTYIGHPSVASVQKFSKKYLRTKYNIDDNIPILTLMCGSRKSEISMLLPIFLKTFKLLSEKVKNLCLCILAATDQLIELISDITQSYHLKDIMIESAENNASVISDSNCVLAKSGTNNIEIALYGKPFIVAYKVNFFSWLYIKSLINIKYASLLNIIANKEIVPEFLQYSCNPKLMSKTLYELITNKDLAKKQILATNQVIESLKISDSNSCYQLIVDKILETKVV